jgi:hypothetical protein
MGASRETNYENSGWGLDWGNELCLLERVGNAVRKIVFWASVSGGNGPTSNGAAARRGTEAHGGRGEVDRIQPGFPALPEKDLREGNGRVSEAGSRPWQLRSVARIGRLGGSKEGPGKEAGLPPGALPK